MHTSTFPSVITMLEDLFPFIRPHSTHKLYTCSGPEIFPAVTLGDVFCDLEDLPFELYLGAPIEEVIGLYKYIEDVAKQWFPESTELTAHIDGLPSTVDPEEVLTFDEVVLALGFLWCILNDIEGGDDE